MITPKWKKEKVLELYKEGKAQIFIERELNMTRKTIRTVLNEAGIMRTKSQQFRVSRGNTLDDTVFDSINEFSAYWIGFLLADGSLTKETNSIQLKLSVVDIKHLEKIKQFFNCTNKITKHIMEGGTIGTRKIKDREMGYIAVHSDKLVERLKYFGFDSYKSQSAHIHPELQNNKDFWRGLIDGDGCISLKKGKPTIHLCGTLNVIEGFIKFVQDNITPTNCKARKTKDDVYQVVFEYKKGREVINYLYNNSNIYLDRKFEKAKESFN